jgi:hypothetical protein
MGAGEWLRLGCERVQCDGVAWAPRCAAAAEGQRLRVERGHMHCGGARWAPRCATMGAGQRLPLEPRKLPAAGARGERNARVNPGAAGLMTAAEESGLAGA